MSNYRAKLRIRYCSKLFQVSQYYYQKLFLFVRSI